jgi:hypothetical protein
LSRARDIVYDTNFTSSAESGLQGPVSNVRLGSILLKNSFSTDDGKILGVMRREPRFRLGGIHERVDVAM